MVAAIVVSLGLATGFDVPARAASAPTIPTVGVTRTTVTVGGIVAGDPTSSGAEIGAQCIVVNEFGDPLNIAVAGIGAKGAEREPRGDHKSAGRHH